MKNSVVSFGKENNISGILTEPAQDYNKDRPIAIFLNGGIISKIGPNGIYVKIVRILADAGFASLRFDFSGIGENFSYNEELTFEESQVEDTRYAMSFLEEATGVNHFVLIGLCTGADACYLASSDERVTGIIPINGSLIDRNTLIRLTPIAQNIISSRYYKKHLFDYRRWLKFFTGKSQVTKSVKKLLRRKRPARKSSSIDTNASYFREIVERLNVPKTLLVYSEGSITYDIFNLSIAKDVFKKLGGSSNIECKILKDIDHTFTLQWSQEYLASLIKNWMLVKFY